MANEIDPVDEFIDHWTDELQRIYDRQTAGEYTFRGVVGSMYTELIQIFEDEDNVILKEFIPVDIPGPVLISCNDYRYLSWHDGELLTSDLVRENPTHFLVHVDAKDLASYEHYYELTPEAVARLGFKN